MSIKRAHSDDRVLQRGLPGKVGAPQGTHKKNGPHLRKLPASTPSDQQTKLRARLKAAEETLRAILSGEVDALMVSGRRGEQVVSLKGGEPTYRMLVEAMSEGAATLLQDGTVLYGNRSFAEMICRPPAKIAGIAVQSLVAETERDRFETLLAGARKAIVKGEFNLRRTDGTLIPVYLSLNRFRGFKGQALGMVITDLSETKRKQAEEIKQTEVMHRLLLEHTISAQEEERRRIARGLHDEAGQMLTALLVGLRTLEDARKLADVKVQGQRLREITAQTIDEVGRLARGLHPTVLDDHGLGVALSRYAAEYTKTHKITVDLAPSELDFSNLPSAVQIALYRILQEALTNVARHSGAKAVSIRFTLSAMAVEVEVIDDGCGFDAKAVAVSSHRLGIQSMRERAAMLGGTVSFIPQRKGTRILVQVPLASQDFQPLVGRRST
ncbi:MAG: PAS domain-containing sensor histidine kinase [Terracidiphilus sp.]|jgi:PAS domain S-box-containing protein